MITILFITIFISCYKKELGNLEYVNLIESECFLEKGLSTKNDPYFRPDTVTYSFTPNNLNIFIGFNATCCGEFTSTTSVEENTINIKIQTTHIGLCNCICYYTYNFLFSGDAAYYKYHVSIDDNLNFSGVIDR